MGMNKGRSLTFSGLFDIVDTIEVPILQRDYAQGRKEEFEIRTLFLNSLFNALTKDNSEEHQPLDLDFVYGNFEETQNKAFSVLDGQQRLTTLYLLHWYLAVKHDHLEEFRKKFVTNDNRSRFTYKTRPSTTEFFDALTSNDIELSNTRISIQIKNSQWFYLSWQQDPTVQACLLMLDGIQTQFSISTVDLYERLINTSKPYITFQFLDLHSFGLSDELYIKMNARGKPLTTFENFKAKLEQIIRSFEGSWPEYNLPFKNNVDGYEYFIHKIDTDWADLFWPYRNVCSDDNTFDDEMMNFIRLIITYQYLLDNRKSENRLLEARSELFGPLGSLKQAPLSKYEALKCLNQETIIRLITVLDTIYRDGLINNKISLYVAEQYYYNEESCFKKVLANTASYDDKLRFYAFYSYLSKSPSPDDLREWLRVIYNLTENTIINTADDFNKALFTIDMLCKFEQPILEVLQTVNERSIQVFVGGQVLEEKIKAHLILKSEDWRKVIIETERNSFLNGQIGCVLNFSGILAHYRENQSCDWSNEQDKHYLERFKKYSCAISSIFEIVAPSSANINYLWERAVLSKGVYFTPKKGNRFNLLCSRDSRNNIPRDHSWRRLLRIGTTGVGIEPKQRFVKAVIDDHLFDLSNLKSSLAAICNTALESEEIEPWRKSLIRHKELMAYCRQGFIENSETEFILLNESQRNHYHSELYTKSLELELKENMSLLFPFSSISYEAVKSREDNAHLTLSGFILDGQRCSIEIYKNPLYFNIKLKCGDPENYSDTLNEILANEEFELQGNAIPEIGLHKHFSNNKLSTESSIKEKLYSLCSSLRDL